MKHLGLVLLAVVMAGLAGCGGGGGSSDSGEFDPTGSVWQFLVSTADAGDTMYTLSFFDSTGAKAVSGVFTAVSAAGTSYSGSWASSGNVVTGASSNALVFTLTVNDNATTGTIDYVTPEGAGTAPATSSEIAAAPVSSGGGEPAGGTGGTDSQESGCGQYAGTWAGTYEGTGCNGTSGSETFGLKVNEDCTAVGCSGSDCVNLLVVDDTLTVVVETDSSCGNTIFVGRFTSASALSGTWSQTLGGGGTWSATKQESGSAAHSAGRLRRS